MAITVRTAEIINLAMPVIILIWLVAFGVLGFILRYHWYRYSDEKNKSRRILTIYFTIGASLIIGMIFSFLTF